MKAAMETGYNSDPLFPVLCLPFVSVILQRSLTFPIIATGITVFNKGGGNVPRALLRLTGFSSLDFRRVFPETGILSGKTVLISASLFSLTRCRLDPELLRSERKVSKDPPP